MEKTIETIYGEITKANLNDVVETMLNSNKFLQDMGLKTIKEDSNKLIVTPI